jgi:hypothetical protein
MKEDQTLRDNEAYQDNHHVRTERDEDVLRGFRRKEGGNGEDYHAREPLKAKRCDGSFLEVVCCSLRGR